MVMDDGESTRRQYLWRNGVNPRPRTRHVFFNRKLLFLLVAAFYWATWQPAEGLKTLSGFDNNRPVEPDTVSRLTDIINKFSNSPKTYALKVGRKWKAREGPGDGKALFPRNNEIQSSNLPKWKKDGFGRRNGIQIRSNNAPAKRNNDARGHMSLSITQNLDVLRRQLVKELLVRQMEQARRELLMKNQEYLVGIGR